MQALTKEEAKLQNKGIDNMSITELEQWIQIYERKELNAEFN